jgi:hypothetical protein
MAKIIYVTYSRNEEAETEIRDRTVLFIDNEAAQQVLGIEDTIRVLEETYRQFALRRATASRMLHRPWHSDQFAATAYNVHELARRGVSDGSFRLVGFFRTSGISSDHGLCGWSVLFGRCRYSDGEGRSFS